MLSFKSKKMTIPVIFSLVAALLAPTLAQAELGGSGATAARQAREQRAVAQKKREERKQEQEAAKKTVEAVQETAPAEKSKPVEPQAD